MLTDRTTGQPLKPGKTILTLLTVFTLTAQPPPPGGPEGVRRRIAQVKAADEVSRSVLGLARMYLAKSEGAHQGTPFAAARYLAAADALAHAAEHRQHRVQKSEPEPPDAAEITRHLDRVYFRLQQADFFVKQSADANAAKIATYAQQYYQQALRASDNQNPRSADECAKTVDELMRALENLAQSTAPPRPLKPGPEPGRP
jgi:hypothetical protein